MSQIPAVSREWHLVRRPQGWPVAEDFALREVPVSAEPAASTRSSCATSTCPWTRTCAAG